MKKSRKTFLTLYLMLALMAGLMPQKVMAAEFVKVAGTAASTAQEESTTEINILDYESNTKATEYVITDVAGMEKLAELVNSGVDDFKGKTVTLKNDLQYDKSKVNNHVPIGGQKYSVGESTYTSSFNGIFDGKGHTISGIHINDDIEYMGLFGDCGLKAVISNIRIADSVFENIMECDITELTFGKIGGVVAYNRGLVQNCVIDETVKLVSMKERATIRVGGIVGDDYGGTILRCKNSATIIGGWVVGGICGGGAPATEIKNCVNYGEIIGYDGGGDQFIGGIIGDSFSAVYESCNFGVLKLTEYASHSANVGGIAANHTVSDILNCFNVGSMEVEGEARADHAGGIAGESWHDYLVSNCYNIGVVTGLNEGAITCRNNLEDTAWLEDCYWLSGTAKKAVWVSGRDSVYDNPTIYEYTESQMKLDAFVEELNANSVALGRGEVWKKDTENINNGYPILKNLPYTENPWEMEIEDIETGDGGNGGEDTGGSGGSDVPSESAYIFKDYTCKIPLSGKVVRIYANGGKDNSSVIAYTNILSSYNYTEDVKGKVKASTGKVIAGITLSPEKPKLVKGKIVDKAAEKIAKAKIKNGCITVTAGKEPGLVYLWVMDTGSRGEYDCCPINVAGAPSTMKFYDSPIDETNYSSSKDEYKKADIHVGKSVNVYLYPAYGSKNDLKQAKDATYTVTVDEKSKSYFTVKPTGKNCYTIMATGLKNGKAVSGKITITCKENGKKATFTVKATAAE